MPPPFWHLGEMFRDNIQNKKRKTNTGMFSLRMKSVSAGLIVVQVPLAGWSSCHHPPPLQRLSWLWPHSRWDEVNASTQTSSFFDQNEMEFRGTQWRSLDLASADDMWITAGVVEKDTWGWEWVRYQWYNVYEANPQQHHFKHIKYSATPLWEHVFVFVKSYICQIKKRKEIKTRHKWMIYRIFCV